jgi:hypothetical protein|tara:strand:- start:1111 stop:1410 length:300 start_codon:yes stop_codon:yes gene_type:complete
MAIDIAKFKRLKKKILKKFPNALTKRTSGGLYYVSDGEGNALTSEYMIPAQSTVALAWHWLGEIIRIDKNIQRTNPNRLSTTDFEKKFNRVSKRNKKVK